ncbi:MAG: hypothetical protein AB9834_23870 [Lentimicrobium sp.]
MNTQSQIRKLPQRFEQKGDLFIQVYEDERNYIYKRNHAETDYFEVFRKKLTRCFDFETKKPTGELKEKYPKDEDFGKWAWCCRSYERAISYTIH